MPLPAFDDLGKEANTLLNSDYAPAGSSVSLSASNLLFAAAPGFLRDLTISETLTHNNAGNAASLDVGFERKWAQLRPRLTINQNRDVTLTAALPPTENFRHKSDLKLVTNLAAGDVPRVTLNLSYPTENFTPKLALNSTTINSATSLGVEGSLALRKDNFLFAGKLVGDVTASQLRSHHLLFGLRLRDTDVNFLAHFNSAAKTPTSEWVFNLYHRAQIFRNDIKHTDDILPTPAALPPRFLHGESAVGAEINVRGSELSYNSVGWGLGFQHRFHTQQMHALMKLRYNSANQLGAALKISDFPSFFANKNTTVDTSVDIKLPLLFSNFTNALSISAKVTF